MVRVATLTALCVLLTASTGAQGLSVLHIKVTLRDAEGRTVPVPRHALLISDNPATAAPRRILTGLDGTSDVRLRPGNYTVESDEPLAFNGKAYEWTQIIDVAASRDAVLELTIDNAEVGPIMSAAAAAPTPETDVSILLNQWQDSVLALWTPTAHASGFLVDAKGLIATNQRVVGAATAVEVQVAPALKVAANVLVADAAHDVAVLWIDPKSAAAIRPVPVACGQSERPDVGRGQKLFSLGTPLLRDKDMTSGTVSEVEAHSAIADLALSTGAAGGPVFTATGVVVGLTSIDEEERARRGDVRVVRIGDLCDVIGSAEKKMATAAAPSGTPLPTEPVRPLPAEAMKEAVQRRAGSLNPYQVSSADFDVRFITPVMVYGTRYLTDEATRRGDRGGMRTVDAGSWVRPLMDFGNWSEYVAALPPVLMIRVTPQLVEGTWAKVARGAARTQGVSLPPLKRPKAAFSRLRVLCGDAEVTPIHPFKLEHRIPEHDPVYEGLYVFDPDALGSKCESVKVVVYSDKDPKGDARLVDAQIRDRIAQDFALYR